MARGNRIQKFAHLLWGAWEIYGIISTIGVSIVSEFLFFVISPFAQEIPLWLKIIYGFGLFLVVLVLVSIIIKFLQALTKAKPDDGLGQSITSGQHVVQISSISAGRDVVINNSNMTPSAEMPAMSPSDEDVQKYITEESGKENMQGQSLSREHKYEDIWITDLARDNVIISHHRFEHCVIHGPAVVKLVAHITMEYCTFEVSNNDIETILIEIPEGKIQIGIIGLDYCIFSSCTFTRIAIAGTPKDMEGLRKDIQSKQSGN